MDPAYARHYRRLYEHHWWWRAREDALLSALRRVHPPTGRDRILDVGCGDGLLFDRLRPWGDVEGIEPDGTVVTPGGAHASRIHVRPFDERFQPDHDYSLILMLDVLEHLDDPEGALRHAAALLAPNGHLVVTVPSFNLLWTNHDVVNHHRTRYTKRAFRTIAAAAGVRVIEEHYWFQWTFPAKLFQRLWERMAGTSPGPARLPPDWLNRALYRWSLLENSTLAALNPPFGSSLFVVCARQAP